MLLEGGGGAFHRIYPGELPRGRGEMLGGLFIFPFERADALSQPRREQIAFMSVRQPRRRAEQSEASPGGAASLRCLCYLVEGLCLKHTTWESY